MRKKDNTILIGILGTVLLGISTWVLITLIELQTLVSMMQSELLSLDKVFGRIYAHMDRLTKWKNFYYSYIIIQANLMFGHGRSYMATDKLVMDTKNESK